jgi:hypothetical protein
MDCNIVIIVDVGVKSYSLHLPAKLAAIEIIQKRAQRSKASILLSKIVQYRGVLSIVT